MDSQKYHKKEIARTQLHTAILLFLQKEEFASAITLAGAASNILGQFVKIEGKKPFLDYARDIHNHLIGNIPGRASYNHHIDKKLGVSFLKHMNSDDAEIIELDLKDCAAGTIIRALNDYTKLYGSDEPLVKAFYNWTWKNMNGPLMMEEYRNSGFREKK